MRRGGSLPLRLEVPFRGAEADREGADQLPQQQQQQEQLQLQQAMPMSPCSVGSHEEVAGSPGQGAKERRAKVLYKSALRFFRGNEFAEAVCLLDKSLAMHATPMANSLREIALQSLRSKHQPEGLRASCPTVINGIGGGGGGDLSPSSSTSSRGEDDKYTSLDKRFARKSVDGHLFRSTSMSSEGVAPCRKPPKIRRAKSHAVPRFGGLQKSVSMSPGIGVRGGLFARADRCIDGNLDRKRLRRSGERIFEFQKMVETLEDDGEERRGGSARNINRFSLDSTTSSVSVQTEETDNDLERMRHVESPDMKLKSGLGCSKPIATDSPPYLPRRSSMESTTPTDLREFSSDPLLLSEERNCFSPPPQQQQQEEELVGTLQSSQPPPRPAPGSAMSGIERPQLSESPQFVGKRSKSRLGGATGALAPPMEPLAASLVPPQTHRGGGGGASGAENSNASGNNAGRMAHSTRKRSQKHLTPSCRAFEPAMPFATPTREELMNACAEMDVSEQVKAVKAGGIKLVAVDFDNTLISIHTEGRWRLGPGDLKQYVRPLFRSLLPALLQHGLAVAIVTFSPQSQLIRDLLASLFPALVRHGENTFVCGANDKTSQLASSASAAAAAAGAGASGSHRTPSREPSGGVAHWASPSVTGKKGHLQVVCEAYAAANQGECLGPREVLLVDDDVANIKVARQTGTNSIWFQASEGGLACEHMLLRDLLCQRWT